MTTDHTVTLNINTDSITRALNTMRDRITDAFRPFAEAAVQMARAFARVADTLRAAANDPVRVAGLTARYQVRGGLDPQYRHPEHRDALIRSILAGEVADDPLSVFLSAEGRRVCAVAVMRGWVDAYGAEGRVYVAHRLWGRDRVEVCAA